MSNEIMQENTPFVECSAFHRGMSVLEASLRNTEDSEAIISGLLKGAAEFYGASRASVVEADWDLGIGVITYEWCKDGVPAQRDMLQCLPMEKFPRWRKALRANKPVVISDLQRLEKVYPDEAAFFREYAEARKNLAKVDWAVDYVITHCAPTSIALMENRHNEADPLTDFLQEVKERAHYHYWLFGHYHDNRAIDEKHILLWEQIVQVI